MTVAGLSLAQFRSWSRLELTLNRQPLAIFGLNGSGKTNILEALSMLAPGRGLRSASAKDQARHGPGAGWRIRARIENHDIQTSAPPEGLREVMVDDSRVAQTALGRLLRVIWLVPAMDRLWTDPPETRRKFLDRLTLSLCPEHAELSLAYDRAMRERNRLLKDQVADPAWYRAYEAQMARAATALTRNRRQALTTIMAAQDERATGFPAATLTLMPGEGFADDTDEARIMARYADLRARDLAAGRSLTGPHRADLGAHWGAGNTPAAQSSTGEQKALLLSLVLANARALSDQPVLLLLDEVAAHLDADRRAALYDQLVAQPAQTILTGTGPELFESFGDRARRLAVSKASGVSAAKEVE